MDSLFNIENFNFLNFIFHFNFSIVIFINTYFKIIGRLMTYFKILCI